MMRVLINIIIPMVFLLVNADINIAGETRGSVVEPYQPEHFDYLDQGHTIPWADAKTVNAFVKQLKSYPVGRDGVPQVPRQSWMTYLPELIWNNYHPDQIKGCAPTIDNFKRQLDGLGIDMIFLPIPDSGMIYPDLYWNKVPLDVDGLPPQITVGNRRLFAALDKLGVRYVNLAPAMILARKHSLHGHCRLFAQESDGMDDEKGDVSHWSHYGVAVSAHVVATEIAKRPWYQSLPKLEGLKAEWVAPRRYGPEDDSRGWRWERRISGAPKDLIDAPILVIGDSNMQQWRGFHLQLMYELKVPVEIMGGWANSLNRLVKCARDYPDWLLKKKLIIWSTGNRFLGAGLNDYVIFPKGITEARKRTAALAGWPSQISTVVTLEKNSTARTSEQLRPYTSALLYGRYRIERIFPPDIPYYQLYPSKTLMAAGWGLLNAKQTWLTKMRPGTRYKISAESMIDHPELEEMAVDQDAYEDIALPSYLITEIKDPDGKPLVDAKGKHLTLPQLKSKSVLK